MSDRPQGKIYLPAQSRFLREAIEKIARRGFTPEEQKRWNERQKEQAVRTAKYGPNEDAS